MKRESLIVKQEGKVLSIKLNRPKVLNALNLDVKEGLLNALEFAKTNPEIHVILLSGEGSSFCAGGDLKSMDESTILSTYEYLGKTKELILAMSQLEKPIIAAVHGYAAGGGSSLALACDLILAEEDSKFIFSFTKVGLIPDNGALFFLPRTIGLYRTKELFFNAGSLSAKTALEWGVVNQLLPKNHFFSNALEYAHKLAEGPSLAIGQIKKATNRAIISDLEDVLEMERSNQVIMQLTEDHKEGVLAFKEKRKPQFQNK